MRYAMDKNVESLQAERKKLRKHLLSTIRHFIKGSIVKCDRTCGTPTCKCAKGQKHIAYYLSLNKEGKTLLYHIPRSCLQTANKWANNYKRLKNIIDALSMLNIQILKRAKPRG